MIMCVTGPGDLPHYSRVVWVYCAYNDVAC